MSALRKTEDAHVQNVHTFGGCDKSHGRASPPPASFNDEEKIPADTRNLAEQTSMKCLAGP
jgi:hypothetical protein